MSFVLKDDNKTEVKGMLIQYVPLADHHDPYLDEFTYGEVKTRARRIKETMQKGNYVFFHTSIKGQRYITAYYVVDRILDTEDAIEIDAIMLKYRNPHLHQSPSDNDIVVFGDTVLSKKLERPLPFTRKIAERLSIGIPFRDDKTDNQNISSATREHREINSDDVRLLLKEVAAFEEQGFDPNAVLSTDEVLEIREIDLENLLTQNHECIEEGLTLIDRQVDLSEGRLDILLENQGGGVTIVEIKLNEIGRRAVDQLKRYMRQVRRDMKRDVKGIIICKGVMPTFEAQIRSTTNIEIYHYGWQLKVYKREEI